MITRLSRRFNRFISIGVQSSMSDPEKRRVRLLNVFYLLAVFAYTASTVETYVVDGVQDGNLILGFGLAFTLGIFFLYAGRVRVTEFYLLLVANLTIFFFENSHGPAAGTYLFYFPFMMLIAFLVDFRKFWLAFMNIMITVLFVVTGIVLRYRFLYHYFPHGVEDSSFLFNLVFAGIMMAAIALVIIRQSYVEYSGFLRRMQEQRETEERMKTIIREKETLLAEVHHRVKNNLAVISSLLNLQMNTVTNDYTREVLRESRNRVASMALIHQKLYKTANTEEIDFGQYAADLVEDIRHSYDETISHNVQVEVLAEHHRLGLTVAVPCGLILNELLSNCYKHAFPAGRPGKITIRFESASLPGGFVLGVEDNGIGLPADFKPGDTNSLGMTIIQSLAEQLDAQWKFGRGTPSGTHFRMEFRTGGK